MKFICDKEDAIDPSNPWKDDAFRRQDISKRLITLIENSNGPTAIQISAGYGFGKTFLLRRLALNAKAAGHIVVFFDAWKSDFLENATVAITTEIISELKATYPDHVDGPIGKLGTAIAPVIAGAALGAIPGLGGAAAQISKLLDKRAEEIQAAKAGISATRAALSDISCLHRPKKLIVIVDELDRARPDFSLKVIEAMKHLFSAEGVFFIAGMDHRALEAAARKIHGDIDTRGYITRLFHYTFDLAAPDLRSYCMRIILERFSSQERSRGEARLQQACHQIGNICEMHGGGLRDIEKIARDIMLFFTLEGRRILDDHTSANAALLISLRHFDRKLIPRLLRQTADVWELVIKMGVTDPREFGLTAGPFFCRPEEVAAFFKDLPDHSRPEAMRYALHYVSNSYESLAQQNYSAMKRVFDFLD